jgi:hypothetical protein
VDLKNAGHEKQGGFDVDLWVSFGTGEAMHGDFG